MVQKREGEIEDTSKNILSQMEGLVLIKIKELLAEMQRQLDEFSEDQEENRDALTDTEKDLLQRVLSIAIDGASSKKSDVEASPDTLAKLIQNDPNIRSNYLQLRAFSDVGKKLGIIVPDNPPPVVPMNEAPEEALSNPNTQKLHTIVEVIRTAQSKLEKIDTKSQVNPSKWGEFIKVVLAACSVVGIGFMLRSSHVYGTHKFWDAKKQGEEKAKKSFSQAVSDQTKRAADELPSLKAAPGHRKVGKG